MTSRTHHVSSSRPDVRRQLFRTQQSHSRSHSSASTAATTTASSSSSLSAIAAPSNSSNNAGPSRHRRGRPRSEVLDDFDSSIIADSTTTTTTSTSATTAATSSTIRIMDSMAAPKKKTVVRQPDVDNILIRNPDGSFDEHVEIPLEMVAAVLQQREEDSIQQQDMIDYGNRELAYKMPNLLAAVQAALRNKVLSLQDDNWMFEG